MSSFTCQCGAVTRATGETDPQSGITFSLHDALLLESAIAEEMVDFAQATVSGGRDAWIANKMGNSYPVDLSDAEVLADLVARCLNGAFTWSTFECPSCGRIARALGSEGRWEFFMPEETGQQAAPADAASRRR